MKITRHNTRTTNQSINPGAVRNNNMTTETKTHWKKQHNYNFLGSYSLPVGSDVILTIKNLKEDQTVNASGKKEKCFVCEFVEDAKPMILNKTNCKIIEKMYNTPFIEEWIGKKVQIYVTKVSAFGTETDALRIRTTIPGGKSEVQLLADLYLTKKASMKVSDQRNAERIMKEKETESYEKLRKELESIN